MVKKTRFLKIELEQLLLGYSLGELKYFKIFPHGSVQTNVFLKTTHGEFVLRYYEQGRPFNSVMFEVELINYLKRKKFPCAVPLKNKQNKYVGIFKDKPFVIFEFVDGQHLKNPNEKQKKQLIKKVAQLSLLTRNYHSRYIKYRMNYNMDFCRRWAIKTAKKINNQNSREKLKWYKNQLLKLDLPESLPKGICHGDFHFSNVLYKDNEFKALIDFDDANNTYSIFDLVGLIESNAWPHNHKVIDFSLARKVVLEYAKYRPLNKIEKQHLFDIYKLSILIDCLWYFNRGSAANFYEKNKIDFLDNTSREVFYEKIFK